MNLHRFLQFNVLVKDYLRDFITTTAEVAEKQDEKPGLNLRTTCSNQNSDFVLEREALASFLKIEH